MKSCLFCTETFEDIKTIEFGCGHKYHSDCLFRWYDEIGRNDNTSRCPQCRQEVISWKKKPLIDTYHFYNERNDIDTPPIYTVLYFFCLAITLIPLFAVTIVILDRNNYIYNFAEPIKLFSVIFEESIRAILSFINELSIVVGKPIDSK